MSIDKPPKSMSSLNRHFGRKLRRWLNRFMASLLRGLFHFSRSPRSGNAGFVLPTVVLLLLVLSLTVAGLSFRAANRAQSAFAQREQKVITNAASPGIERAKGKLEYLFTQDTRFPSNSTPASDLIYALMLNVNNAALGVTALDVAPADPNVNDPYTLPGETRIDVNGDGVVDNAWRFPYDLDASGAIDANEYIAYSVLMDDAFDGTVANNGTVTVRNTPANRADDTKIEDDLSQAKANALVTRNGPINTDESLAGCGGAREPEQGWLAINSAQLEKNIQVTAFASNGKDVGRTVAALDFQQVRRASRGNKWGAWFKYDLELHPGPDFNWNGAMHTDGNMIVTNNLRAHMISSQNSCLYSQESSEVTMAQFDNNGDGQISPDAGDFQGQLVQGAMAYGDLDREGNPGFHIFTTRNARPDTDGTAVNLTVNNDSVRAKTGQTLNNPENIAVDPVALFTQNVLRHRSTANWQRDPGWNTNPYSTRGRIFNQQQAPPYLDDFSRADNRYGPRPEYGSLNWVTSTDDGTNTTTRSSAAYDKQLGDEIISTDPQAANLTSQTGGLDGYWERQSIQNGMRLIVGQRLELGNIFGWGGNTDPLYPPNASITNKQRQRQTLRDNLAAVQGMAVYHYESNNGQFPLACMAVTAHPGTRETLQRSRDFTEQTYRNTSNTAFTVISNVFTGKGTNGWEFGFPSAFDTEAEFALTLAPDQPLGIALRNLANFAGDPKGGSPSFSPVQEAGVVHPFPQQAMWGDFSILRRIFNDRLDNTAWRGAITPTATGWADYYGALSPADKATLHSSACTVGLLAYSASRVNDTDFNNTFVALFPNQGQAMTNAGRPIWNAISASAGLLRTGCTASGGNFNCANTYLTPEQVIASLTNPSPELLTAIDALANASQVERDRKYGFAPTPASTNATLDQNGAEPGNFTAGGQGNQPAFYFNFSDECHPDNPNGIVGRYFNGRGNGITDEKAGLAVVCNSLPKFPALYYLFPKVNHDHDGGEAVSGVTAYPQPAAAEYVNQPYLADTTTGVNRSGVVAYKVVGDSGANAGIEEADDAGMRAIALEPRYPDSTVPTGYAREWKLPYTVGATGQTVSTLNPETMQILRPGGTFVNTALLDKVMYNGREEMAVRVLEIDLDQLTSGTKKTNPDGSDYWISNNRNSFSGIVYAYREDAAREDSIVRPAAAGTTWSNCDQLNELLSTTACYMNPNTPQDPPLSRRADGSLVGISTKPVDFAPDPARRANGFRLNAELNSNQGDISDGNRRTWGLTFVTDNAAYIEGSFNPHTGNGNNTLEEFTQTLADGAVAYGNPFYDDRTTLNTAVFTTDANDRWRVAEILADAVSVLSNGFVDGAVEEGFINNRTANSTKYGSLTSFHNQQRPLQANGNAWIGAGTATTGWLRANGAYADKAVPILVGRNGESRTSLAAPNNVFDNAEDGAEFDLPDERSTSALIAVNTATPPRRVNATIISGIVPSRNAQGYGGLHNFPRFQEAWNTDLFMQGAFLQLNFSTTSTGPFDQDAWNPGDTTSTNELIRYYDPPNRRWGYDVALQYSPAGPIAQRFVTVERPRSEFYREPQATDPYVVNLRCATLANGANPTRVFPNEAANYCPTLKP
jgi:hypothetical protein